MIRISTIFCKLTRIRRSSSELYEEQLRDFHPKHEVCPSCNAAGGCGRHDTYERELIDIRSGKPVCHTLTVQRLRCRHCGRTHAVLSDFIIPYAQYSLFFILHLLTDYFRRSQTVAALCEAYEITPTMLYRWKALFLRHCTQWLHSLDEAVQFSLSAASFPDAVWRSASFPNFLSDFLDTFHISFLQNHAGASCVT